MLKRVYIRGFKSLADVEVKLEPLTVLFGPNASGKSNFLDALLLLSKLGTSRTLRDAFDYPYRGKPIESFPLGKRGIEGLVEHERLVFSIEADLALSEAVVDGVNRQIRNLSGSSTATSAGGSTTAAHLGAHPAGGLRCVRANPRRSAPSMTVEKRIFVIAGPNGAGKTTFATEFLPNEADCPIFVNADLIADGLSPFRSTLATVQAARLMLKQIDVHTGQGRSFAFETTLSGRRHARRIPPWQEKGYRVKLFFLRLPTPEAAIARVAQRVSEGGHDVPEPVIRRRFDAGWRNFEHIYRDLVDSWAVYDNSGEVPVLVGEGGRT